MKRPIILRRWATEGTCNPVPDDKYAAGFVSEKPDEYYLNQMQFDEESFIIANMETGVPTDGADDVVYANKAIYFQDGSIYVRLPEGSQESLVGRPYKTVQDELQVFYNAYIAHAEDLDNPHELTPSQANTYSKPEFDDLDKGQYDSLDKHIKTKNPHKVTFTQLNSLGAIEGGLFTGVVDFVRSITVNNFFLASKEDSFSFGSEDISFGVNKTEPVVDTPEGRQIIFHRGNYFKERNKLQPKYSVAPAVCIVPFVSSINFLRGNTCIESDWDDFTYTDFGLTLAGKLTFTNPERLVGCEQTVRLGLTDGTTLMLGNIVITKADGSVSVTDSGTEIWKGASSGYVTYVRTEAHGWVYVNGHLVADKAHDAMALELVSEISGTGSIKGLYIWVECLTREQIASLS